MFDLTTGAPLYDLQEENEDLVTFALSPNSKLIATSNKQSLIRVYDEATRAQITSFKITGQMGLELCFDPSSRFLAVGTAMSQVRIYDIDKKIQTHHFVGHRGVITKLAFLPGADSLKVISSAEDFLVKVWDLVLGKDIVTLKGNLGRVTSIEFTRDAKTMFVGARDGKISLYNTQNQFKLISTISCQELGLADEEVTCLKYVYLNEKSSLLVIGGETG